MGTEMDNTTTVGFDLETASADTLYSGGHDGPFVRLFGTIEERLTRTESADHYPPKPFRTSMEVLEGAPRIYGANIFRFDLPALARHHGADYDALAAKAWDIQTAERLLDPPMAKHGTPAGYYDLDSIAQRYGVAGKTGDLKGMAKLFGGYDRIPMDDPHYLHYLRGDLKATDAVYVEQLRRIESRGLMPYALREMRVAAIQARMTLNGWAVDKPLLAVKVAEEDAKRQEAISILSTRYGVPLTKADGKPSASPWATKGGRAALEEAFKAAGAAFVPRTKTGDIAIGKDPMGDGTWIDHEKKSRPGMLHPDAFGHLAAVRELCRVITLATGASMKYAEISRYTTAEGRVHCGIGEDQASGRWAHTRPSSTNMDKGEERRPLVADPGHMLLTCDLAQLDMRALAGLSQDPAYMAMFEYGRDAHNEIADKVFGRHDGDWRHKSKRCGHGWNYGMSVNGLVNSGVERSVAAQFDLSMNQQFPVLCQWRQGVRDLGGAGHFLDNGFGRLMRCDAARAWTQAPALMGQGCARDIMCESLLRLVTARPDVTPYLRAVVHDELILSVPEAGVEEWQRELWDAFTWVWRGVPILCEVSNPAKSWADCAH